MGRFKTGKIEGDTKDMGRILAFLFGIIVLILGYEVACKLFGVKSVATKKDYDVHTSGSEPKKVQSTPQSTNDNGGENEDEKEKHPWKNLRGSKVIDDGTKTPLQGMWIVKERNSIIFSKTDVGKSLLAGQMALDIAAGRKSEVIPMDNAPARQFVMYFDIEKNGGDFNGKYQSYLNSHPEIGQWIAVYGWTDDYEWMLEEIYDKAIEKRDTVVFIDNITALLGDKSTESFKTLATRLQIYLKTQKGITLTFVLIMHNNDMPNYITLDTKDVKNDGNLGSTFAENIIGLGMTTYVEHAADDKEIIRIKACKNKSGVTSNPVIVARKVEEPYLHFERIMMCDEKDTITSGAKLPSTTSTAQPDSASPQYEAVEEEAEELVAEEGRFRLSAPTFGNLYDTEKLAIYGLVKQEFAAGKTGRDISKRLQEKLGVDVSEVMVSNIKKDKGDMPKKYQKDIDKDFVGKIRQVYLADN